jgi:hypothetical protein
MRQLSKGHRRVLGLLGAGAVLIGGIGAPVILAAGTASAATCSPGTPCIITGTATLTSGTLTMVAPGSLTWATTLTGLTQDLVDTVPADQGFTVNDATGSATGWNVSVEATTFTSTVPAAATLPDTGTFSTTGSVTSATAATPPTAACTSGAGTCTLPVDTAVTYPVALTTAAAPTPTVIYEAATGSGLGSIDIGGAAAADPVGWWLAVRPDAAPGAYASTVTIALASGP